MHLTKLEFEFQVVNNKSNQESTPEAAGWWFDQRTALFLTARPVWNACHQAMRTCPPWACTCIKPREVTGEKGGQRRVGARNN